MKTSDIRIGDIVSVDNLTECKVIEIKENHLRVEYIREDTQLPHRPLIEIERISPVHVYDMEKETLEEAAERYAKQFDYAEDSSPQIDFITGANWQAERMYSEDEVDELVNNLISNFKNYNGSSIDSEKLKWFYQQLKKK